MAEQQTAIYDPTSYSYAEGVLGQVPSFIRLGSIRIHAVTGVPSAILGANGDFALRTDGVAGSNTTIYHKEAGVWTGLTA